jgi:hypothetical protein
MSNLPYRTRPKVFRSQVVSCKAFQDEETRCRLHRLAYPKRGYACHHIWIQTRPNLPRLHGTSRQCRGICRGFWRVLETRSNGTTISESLIDPKIFVYARILWAHFIKISFTSPGIMIFTRHALAPTSQRLRFHQLTSHPPSSHWRTTTSTPTPWNGKSRLRSCAIVSWLDPTPSYRDSTGMPERT